MWDTTEEFLSGSVVSLLHAGRSMGGREESALKGNREEDNVEFETHDKK